MKLLPLENEVQFPFGPALFGSLRIDHLVGAVVPYDYVAGAVVPFRDDAFEATVVQRMIFSFDGKAFVGRIKGGSFRDRPGSQHPLHFQTKIVMKAGGSMLLDDETVAGDASRLALGFGRLVEPALPFVLFQSHVLT